jgi:hypothetical protein
MLAPIEWKVLVAESTIWSQLNLVKLAEVVRVQLKQIGEDSLLLRCGGNEFNVCQGPL